MVFLWWLSPFKSNYMEKLLIEISVESPCGDLHTYGFFRRENSLAFHFIQIGLEFKFFGYWYMGQVGFRVLIEIDILVYT